ncbi:MAG: SIMPL domain-containing protein [Chloroflexi bacterium]|nr:SIMPL domain-containing protein [Chloroflexota bacterium]
MMFLPRNVSTPLLLTLALFLLALPLSAQENAFPRNILTVQGNGTVFGTPDIAYIEIGFEIADPDLNYAFDQTSATLIAIRDALLEIGIESEDLQTRGLSLWVDERYDNYDEEPRRFFRLSNGFRITLRDIELITTAIDAGVAAGANNIYNLQYGIADPGTLEEQARARAAADAKARAANLAALFGKSVGDAIQISEYSAASYGNVRTEALAMADFGTGGGGGPIEAGQLSVQVNLTVTFALVPDSTDE